MGDQVSTTVALIEDVISSDDYAGVIESVISSMIAVINYVIGEPLLMYGLTFAAVAGLTGLVFKVSRRLGFKAHR